MAVDSFDIIRAVAKLELDGTEDVIGVFHFRYEGAASVSESLLMLAVADHLDTAYGQIEHALTNDLVFVEIDFYNVTQATSMGSEPWPLRTVGGSAAEQLPPQVAALVSFRTATTQHPGKKYVGVLTEDSNEGDGVVTAATITALAAFAARLLDPLTVSGQTITIGNWNYQIPRWALWIGAAVDLIWSTQRRRKPGVGS